MRSRLWLTFFLPLLMACIISTATIPTPIDIQQVSIPNATLIYYDISGATESELREQMDLLSPRGYDGYQGDATTQWYISWHWPTNSDGSCRLSDTVVTYEINVKFPRWVPPSGASNDLILKWNKYISVLAEHENGHVNLVLTAIPKVEKAVKHATCDTANSLGEAVLAQIRIQDTDYDRQTDHGATQGARFP